MSLIRKPDAKVFQDSATVKVVRGTQLVVGEGGKSAMQATARLWLGAMVLMALLAGATGLFTGDAGSFVLSAAWVAGCVFLLIWMFRAPTRDDAVEQIDECGLPLTLAAPRAPAASAPQGETIQVRYWPKALFNKAFTLAALGLFLTVTTVLAIVGVPLIARGVLLIAAALGSGNCLEVTRTTVTVRNLLGPKSMPLAAVETVFVHTFRRRRLDVSCLVGSRKVIVIEGRIAGERRHLLVPYTLLGMSREAAEQLCQEVLQRTGAEVAPRRHGLAASPPPPAFAPRPPSYADTPEPTFDPDAIMARYLAERSQVTASSGMPRPPGVGAPRGFGRKGLATSD